MVPALRWKKSNGSEVGRRWTTARRKPPEPVRFTRRCKSETSSLPGGTTDWNSTVGTYRLYRLDGVDKVASAEWLEANSDEAAIDAAEPLHNGRKCELWQANRLVAVIDGRRKCDGEGDQ